MSQCSRVTSIPNLSIAAAPTVPTMVSVCSATASSARPSRSSPNADAAIPYTSGTAHARAQSAIPAIADGFVSRFAIRTSMT
ncbi:hypothetical protein J2S43_003074 [Catenuloplanes nepalensis]|uniref:Uncharacterized protein n=1 Tax=Catenuloplanes nepalensis TaxID=587533 RepID=A0ABT9MMU0_9ACTN|nr:hypothetical protein [Catenuloplanes nepalensis]MDP9792913.1 hypothetical protein [Catenuloplanes nepalensis]MDP9794562.1 hypothetical protein [Catenuloplanes nepalensis]